MNRKKALQSLVDNIYEKPVLWGVDDCTMFAAGWVEDQTGLSVQTKSYSSRHEAHKIISEYGGLDKIWAWSLNGILQRNYGEPKYGDVGLVDTDNYGLVGVIFAHAGIAIWRTDNGYTFLTPRKQTIHSVWSLPNAE